MTERRRAEDEVRRSELRYRGLAEALPLLVWTMRVGDGQSTYANAQFQSYYGPIGPERAERLIRNHPEDAPAMEAAWTRAVETGTGYSGQWRIRRHDGLYRWHKISLIPIRLDPADGAVAEWLGTALDVDDIITARLAVEEARGLLGIALDAAEAGTWDWDMRTGLVTLSPESARMHGLRDNGAAHTLSASEWTALIHPDDVADVWIEIRRAVESGTSYAAEFRAGGRWLYARGRTLCGAEGHPQSMVGLHLDITERKAVEAALRTATRDAEAARTEAERASAAKSEFLAAMSHEIRTPLNGVLGFAQIGHRDAAIALEARRNFARILEAGKLLQGILNDVLDMSKIEAGKLTLDRIPTRLRPAVRHTIELVQDRALAKGIDLRLVVDERVPEVVVTDPLRLGQILLNLLSNAVKFTDAGHVALNVDLMDDQLMLMVTDSGVGMSEEEMSRLFQAFEQADSTTTRRYGGTGLGLAISKRLVELMGGTISVSSRPGSGSAFTVRLPMPPAAEAPADTTHDAALAGARRAAGVESPRNRLDGMRVLVAEDNAINQIVIQGLLELEGASADVVPDGHEAVNRVSSQNGAPYHVVLLDLMMPGIDGYETARRIRVADPGLPIIGQTAHAMQEDRANCIAAGMVDRVTKPIDTEELVRSVLKHARRA